MEQKNSFICAACGNAACSQKCHKEHFSDTDICQFKYNFKDFGQKHSLPSLTSENVHYANKYKLAQGTPINKTSRNFISAYKSNNDNSIYL